MIKEKIMKNNSLLEATCRFKNLDKLKPGTRLVMLEAGGSLQEYLNTALIDEFNTNLYGISKGLLDNRFSAEQAIEVIHNMPAHREAVGNEVERVIRKVFNASVKGESVESAWPMPKKVNTHQVMENIAEADIKSLSEDDLMDLLGESPEEADSPTDFINHFFHGLDNPAIYLGGMKYGAIQHLSTWLSSSDEIEALGYDQMLANQMRRLLTTEERASIPSGGRRSEFCSESLDVVTFESDSLPEGLQFGVIVYLTRYLPLISIVYSGGKSYHATFSLKGLTREQIMAVRQVLANFGGDRAVMAPHQLVRLGGVTSSKEGNKLQRVLWIDPNARCCAVDAGMLAELLSGVEAAGDVPSGVFPVPAGGIGNNMSADIIFPAMGEMRRLFMRGSTVHEIASGGDAEYLEPLSAERFCSLVESAGHRVARKELKKGSGGAPDQVIWRSTTFPVSSAKILLETDASRKHLPAIRQIVNCPVMTSSGDVLTKGYHKHNGGTYIGAGDDPEEVIFGNAVRSLLGILGDFEFAAKSDLSRAFASLISPALKMGGWIGDDFPLDLAEATESQSGKTFRQKLVCRIYNEVPTSITLARGGVGSIDESISAALVKGRPFVTLANMRGKIDSTIFEEALRGSGRVNCRTLRKSTEVDCEPFMWQLSTNGAELTRDLANRAIVTRIRKKPAGHEWTHYPEGDLERHVQKNQSHYLGCVFAILSKWDSQGRQTTRESRHDFRGWCRALDAIVQMCGLEPLLDGHKEQQERTANPQLQWLREIIISAKPEQYEEGLFAHDIADLGEECGIDFPGNPFSKDEPYIRVGRILSKVFRDAESDSIEVDGFTFARVEEPDYSPGGSRALQKKYLIRRSNTL